MPAARHDVRQLRPAHERGVIAPAPRDLLDRAAKEDHGVRRGHPRHRAERELELARPELDLVGAQRQPELRKVLAQELDHRVDHVVALLGEVLIPGGQKLDFRRAARLPRVRGLEVLVDDPEDVELHLQADDEIEALRLELRERGAQQRASAVGNRAAVMELGVAKEPAGIRRPRKDAEGRRIGHQQKIGRALHLGHADAAARSESRKHRLVSRVLEKERARERDAALERVLHFACGQRLAPQNAVLVREGETHRLEVVRLDLLQHFLLHVAQADFLRRSASNCLQYSSSRSLGPMPSTAGGPVISRALCASSTIGGFSPAWFFSIASRRMRR